MGLEGPFDEPQLRTLVAKGKIKPEKLMWIPGMDARTNAASIPLVNKYILLNT